MVWISRNCSWKMDECVRSGSGYLSNQDMPSNFLLYDLKWHPAGLCSGHQTETIIDVLVFFNQCLKTAWSVQRFWYQRVCRKGTKKEKGTERKEEERKWKREREREERCRATHLLKVCLILARQDHTRWKTAPLHNAFLHRGLTIDRIPHWQTPWTFLAACIRNLSRTQREQQQHKLKGCHSVLSEATGDLGFWWRVWCYSCVKQQPGCWGRTRSFVIISAGNGVLQNTLYVQYFIRLIIVISWKGCSYSTWQTPRNVELLSKRTISCSLEIIFPVQFSVFDRYLLAFVCFSHQQYSVYDIALW